MREEGVVTKIIGADAVVEISPKEACSKCCSCGASEPRQIIVAGEQVKGLKAGDHVDVEINTRSMMRVYILMYMVPLIIFVGVVLCLHAFLGAPVISFIGALAATAIGYIFIGRYIRGHGAFVPNIRLKKPKG